MEAREAALETDRDEFVSEGTSKVAPRKVSYADLVAKVRGEQNFCLSRWGDGEWYSVLGRTQGRNKDGHQFTDELGQELRLVLRKRPPYHLELVPWERAFGSQVHDWLFAEELDDLDWINPNILHRASMRGRLQEMISALQSRPKWLAVGPEHLAMAQGHLGFSELVVVPQNCFSHRGEIIEQVLKAAEDLPANSVISFSAGMTANLLVHDLFERFGNHFTIIDTGSVWDPYAGVLSRSYMTAEGFPRRN